MPVPRPRHQFDKLTKQVPRVVRSRRRLRVVLHTECMFVWCTQSFDTSIIQADMVISTPSGNDDASTAKPWLWLEISTRLVSLKRTGWLPPR